MTNLTEKHNNMERAVSTITQFDLSKDQIETFASQVINDLYNNGGDVVHIAICLKAMEQVLSKVKAGISDLVLAEVMEVFPEKTFHHKGAMITKTAKADYDYSTTELWKELANRKKALEKLMKTIKDPVADTETGEVINPAIRKVSESLTIKIK